MKNIKNAIREWKNIALDKYSKKSYSQEGEDMILNRMFDEKTEGFYVDVGAHHPMRFSNTYFFYKRGWRGINIDAMPGSMKKFDGIRSRDINLELGVSSEAKELTYYMFNDPALNGFDEELTRNREKNLSHYYVKNRIQIKTCPLSDILKKHLPKNQKIDFLSIDVEGLDLEVIESNDWVEFRPTIVLVETLETHMNDPMGAPVAAFMKSVGYSMCAKTLNTAFFRLDR